MKLFVTIAALMTLSTQAFAEGLVRCNGSDYSSTASLTVLVSENGPQVGDILSFEKPQITNGSQYYEAQVNRVIQSKTWYSSEGEPVRFYEIEVPGGAGTLRRITLSCH